MITEFLDSLTVERLLFLVIATWTVVCGSLTVIQRHPMHCAISLVGTMFGLAACLVMLGSWFLGLTQVLLHGGVVVVLFLHLVRLLEVDTDSLYEPSPSFPVIVLTALFAGHLWRIVIGRDHLAFLLGRGVDGTGSEVASSLATVRLDQLASALLERWWFAFEAVSILVLATIVACVALSKRRLE